MSTAFQASPTTVGNLLTKSHLFQVPSFQRHYSWKTEQAERLVNDLLDASDNSEEAALDEYFLGSIVLLQTGQSEQNTRFIIDGQQRLITTTILLALLRDLAEDEAEANNLNQFIAGTPSIPSLSSGSGLAPMRIAIREHAQEFFRRYVQTIGSTLVDIEDEDAFENAATASIANVRDDLRARLIDLGPGARARLSQYVTQSCIIIEIVSTQIDRAFAIFSVINDTGKKLTLPEILKAQIIGELPEQSRVGHLDTWTALEASLDKRFETFFSHLRAAHSRNQKAIINEIIGLRNTAGSSEAFMQTMFIPYANNLTHIFGTPTIARTSDVTPEMERYFAYWRWLTHDGWIAPVLRWMSFGTSTEETLRFFEAFDQLLYGLVLLGHGHDKRQTRMRRILRAMDNGTLFDEESGLFLTSVEQGQALYNASNNLYSRSQVTCRLIVLRINDAILLQQGKTPDINPNAPSQCTIEHFLPRKPSQDSQWRTWFADADVREYCTNALGNFLLISAHKNDKLKNFDFDKKHEIIFDAEDLSHYPITTELANATSWHATDVISRNERFLEILASLFNLKGKKGLEVLNTANRKRLAELKQTAA